MTRTPLSIVVASLALLYGCGDSPIYLQPDAAEDGGVKDSAVDATTDAAEHDATISPNVWAHAFGGTGRDEIYGIAATSDGGVVGVGSFEGSVSFGGASLTSAGNQDVVVFKLDHNGVHVWSRQLGSTGLDAAYGVAVDSSDNVYVTGRFVGTINIDGQSLVSAGSSDGFLMRLDGSNGNKVWALRFGGSMPDYPYDVGVNSSGTHVAIAGAFDGTANFGGASLTTAGSLDAYLAVYAASDGSHIWSKRFGSTGIDEARALGWDGADVVVAGNFKGTVSFGGPSSLVSTGGSTDVFVARYAGSNGAYGGWANRYGATSEEIIESLAVGAGAVYVGGHFGGTVSFGGPSLVSGGGYDGFVAKYDVATGSHSWSKRWGGPSDAATRAVAVSDRVWFGGKFSGTAQVGNAMLASAGISDVVLADFSITTGATNNVDGFGGTGGEMVHAIAATDETVWIAGSHASTMSFFGVSLSVTGMTDAFIARTAL